MFVGKVIQLNFIEGIWVIIINEVRLESSDGRFHRGALDLLQARTLVID